ncbi:MAG: hypothetical protein JW920_08650 [Deltaproteobacteria bacterium]|nr:hypothetical protein [Deltaproteobacteria bacterium]
MKIYTRHLALTFLLMLLFSSNLNAQCRVQGVNRTYTSSNKVKFQVQYYISPSCPKPCFISTYIPNKTNQSSSFRYIPAGRLSAGVPKGQHHFSDNISFEAEYLGSQSYTSSTLEVVIYDEDHNLCSSVINWGQTWRKSPYSRTYSYMGNYPGDRENGWSDNLQGVTQDSDNWFFTQKERLWKFPITHHLGEKVTTADLTRGILKKSIPSLLKSEGYDHFGDLDFYRGILLVPMEGRTPIIVAVFKASNLEYLGYVELTEQKKAGWCAVNPIDGYLYSSNSLVKASDPIYKYRVNWDRVASGQLPQSPGTANSHDAASARLERVGKLKLFDEFGDSLELKTMQGGVFSHSGCLYLVNGYCCGQSTRNTGVMVFDSENGRRVAHSTNGSRDFNFEYHPGSYCGPGEFNCREEPEGITIWDLDSDRRAPQISGQLHVIMIDNMGGGDDDLYFKHYRIHEE